MLPEIRTAEEELALAGKLNPGPWEAHSRNVGIAARRCSARRRGSCL